MSWTNIEALAVGRSKRGAIRWGVLAAIDQLTVPFNVDRPHVQRITDAQLLQAVRQGPLSSDQLIAFAKEYEVFRYPLNVLKGRAERTTEIAQALDTIYRVRVSDGRDLAELWWRAISFVRNILDRYPETAPRNMYSFCMKALWFYQPETATMWDSFAVKGLNEWLRVSHGHQIKTSAEAKKFFADFEILFRSIGSEIQSSIAEAAAATGHLYPYPRRVLDKALWFLSTSDAECLAWLRRIEANPARRQLFERLF